MSVMWFLTGIVTGMGLLLIVLLTGLWLIVRSAADLPDKPEATDEP